MNGLRWAAAALVVVLAVVWVRVWLGAGAELDAAVAAEQSGETAKAIDHYQYAIRWYSPLASAPQDAADALWRIGTTAAEAGDRATGLAALRRLRGGILATRGLHCPLCDRLDGVNTRLADLIADEQLALGQPTIRDRSRDQLVADHLALLRLDPIPDPGWALMAVLGFVTWVGGGFAFIFVGLDAALKPKKPAFGRLLAVVITGFAAWLTGLWMA